MATYIVPPSQVKAKIEDSNFKNGDTIIVRAVPGDTEIYMGVKVYYLPKYFNLICDQPDTPYPDPFGYNMVNKPPKTWAARAVSPVTIVGMWSVYGGSLTDNFQFNFENLNWTIRDYPDWPGKGETWASLGYTQPALFFMRPNGEVGTSAKANLKRVHFEGPKEFTHSSADIDGDSPLTMNYYKSNDPAAKGDFYLGMIRADGAAIAPFLNPLPAGRGPWPGVATELRNKRFVAEFNTELCYNAQSQLPLAIGATFCTELIMEDCSFRNLCSAYSADPRRDGSFTCISKRPWMENLYGDYIHVSAEARKLATPLIAEGYRYKEYGVVMAGRGNCAGQDLGNPHVDFRQFYGDTGMLLPRVQIMNSFNGVGAMDGLPARSGAQDIFDGGAAIMKQIKVYRHLNPVSRDKAFGQQNQSMHIEGLQGFVAPEAPTPFNVNSAGVYPVGSGAAFITSQNEAALRSRGLIRNTNVAAWLLKNSNPQMVNNKLVPSSNIPATVAPNANVKFKSLAHLYECTRQPDWPEDLVDYLTNESFDHIAMCATPAVLENGPVAAPLISAKELIQIGDMDSTGSISMVTPGLEWSEWSHVGDVLVQNWSSSPGTIKDGNHLQLRYAPGIPTPTTSKDFYFKVKGQQLKWTAITTGTWKYPRAKKTTEVGTIGRTSAAAAMIASPTTRQKQCGIMWARFKVSKPSWVTAQTTNQFFSGVSGRGIRNEITHTTGTTYGMTFGFGSSGGGQLGRLGTTSNNMAYDEWYEVFFVADFGIVGQNSGLIIRKVSDNSVFLPWTTASAVVGSASEISWDYSQPVNTNAAMGLRIGGGTGANAAYPIEWEAFGLWAGTTLTRDDGTGNGTVEIYDPGSFPPERMGINGKGMNGTAPYLFLLGETTPSNRGTGGTWALTSDAGTLTDVGGYKWANTPLGQGPLLSLVTDDIPSVINEGDTFSVTVRATGSNEALTFTPTLSAGLELVGGPSFTLAENAKATTFQVKAVRRGVNTISIANSVGYTNPDQAQSPVGVLITFTISPATGFTGSAYHATVRFAP